MGKKSSGSVSHALYIFLFNIFRFGGEMFSLSRMSWIKTNFLWMMYRCGWAAKRNQERVLAVRITRVGFDHILSRALTGQDEKAAGMMEKSEVRLQWDPDHGPGGESLRRKAIQLGLRNEVSCKLACLYLTGIIIYSSLEHIRTLHSCTVNNIIVIIIIALKKVIFSYNYLFSSDAQKV